VCFRSHARGELKVKSSSADDERRYVMVAAAVNTVQRIWPKAAVGLAVAINAVWIAALGYGVWALF
jgi:hypothetical protein